MLSTEKRAHTCQCSRSPTHKLAQRSRSQKNALTLAQFYLFFIFIFPWIVLPFCYFSVVRKVTERPVLFLPHPSSYTCAQLS